MIDKQRPIKFRAWDKQFKMMAPAIELFRHGQSFFHFKGIGPRAMNHPQLVIEQFTGLHDRHNVEIFEGDLLFDGEDGPHESIFQVVWIPELAQFRLDHWQRKDLRGSGYDDLGSVEGWMVIGNIHEHPELLDTKGAKCKGRGM